MGTIVSIAFSPPSENPRPEDRYHRVPAASARLAVDRGIETDRKSKGGKRQINIMSAASLAGLRDEGFKTAPGEMGEQIVIEGIEIDGLKTGARLRLGGEAIVEVDIPRTGCDRFERIQGKFKGLARGRMGVMAFVVNGGTIAVGDAAVVIE